MMIGICCPPELDVLYRQIEELAKVNGVEVERTQERVGGRLIITLAHNTMPPFQTNRQPATTTEDAVYYLVKGLRMLWRLKNNSTALPQSETAPTMEAKPSKDSL